MKPINRVSVVSTGTVQIRPEHVETNGTPLLDGSLLLLPTPGHTPGSMSLLLRGEGLPTMMFVGDVTYDVQLLAADRVPGVGDATVLHDTTRQVNLLAARHPGMPVLAAHDPAAASLLAAALRQHETVLD